MFGTRGMGAVFAAPILSVLLGVGYILYPNLYPAECQTLTHNGPEDNPTAPNVVLQEGRLPGIDFYKSFPWRDDGFLDLPDPFPFIWSQKENPLED